MLQTYLSRQHTCLSTLQARPHNCLQLPASRVSNQRLQGRAQHRSLLRSHKVTVDYDGGTVELEVPEGATILEAALDKGIELKHDCKMGVCMTCPGKVVSHHSCVPYLLLLRLRVYCGFDYCQHSPFTNECCCLRQISGKVDQSAGMLDDGAREKGYALLCVSQPLSDCKVATISEVSVSSQLARWS